MSSSSSSEQDPALMSLEDYCRSLYIDCVKGISATNSFADENLISQNTFFKVYKGQLLDSDSGELINIVARKCLQETVGINEVRMSKDIKHRNIVSIFKIAGSDDGAFIINKHEANGSLEKHLSGSTLTWIQRLHICVRIADALRYIHNLQDDESVIHGNIKSSHILLDHNWEPKLNGFGFATRVKKHHLHLTSKYNGSLEYMDPEYERTGGLTHKSDVFSFGVVLFEVLFGRKAEGENWYFARLARSHYEARTLDGMINSDLQKQIGERSLKIFSDTAYFCLKEGRALRPDMDQIFKKLREAFELQQIHESYVKSSNHLKGKNMDHLRIPLSDIESATNKFSTNCIGSGGYGTVYKAELDIFDSTMSAVSEGKIKADFPKRRRTVAVKRLERKQGEVAGFFTEIEMLTNCKHPNIVSLLGFCEEGPERILVYEYVSNGSLSDYFENFNNTALTWAQRLHICLDIAHGLDYLHSSTEEKPMIIHRDIKSDNILLDNDWVAKIADFGLSRLHPAKQKASTIETGTIAGTEVYLDPEYMETGRLKKESDIYSFGVVLFEVVSGKLAYDKSYSIKNEKGLLSIVKKCFSEGTLKKVIDPNLKEAYEGVPILDDGLDQESVDTFLDIAYQCLAHTQAQRPTMKVIINELEKALKHQENRKDGFHISLKDINLATRNFSDDKCIGEGRYWKQYEGHILLANRLTTLIVKRWDKKSSEARQQYLTELKVLIERKHENIVALVGHRNESSERVIVYEHATNGSLDKHLDDVNLTWTKRLKICVGIATGLKFLHEDAEIIHRDIKSSSVLLDYDWEPKICNFELSSKNQDRLKVEHATDNAYGSLGYLDPMPGKRDYLNTYSDVYSLGVVLMEILCGRLAWGEGCEDHSASLGPLAERRFEEGKLDELVFEGVKEQIVPQSFTTFASIAARCLQRYGRPAASEVVIQLKRALELQEKLPISLEYIKLGTGNFSDAKFIGEGRYWKQYKGDIPHANGLTTVVVKQFDTKCYEGRNQFIAERKALLEYEHENIIRLAGFCDEVNEKIIVYEHASNGRLSEHLKDSSLTWLKRLKICIDVATGLEYLHMKWMIHGNIKSGSILIDSEWKAIITNLELLKQGWTVSKTSELDEIYAYNSFGYIDPVYNEKGAMTRRSDIYSLGVVVMEILCGRLAWEEGCKDHSQSLGPLAKRRYNKKGKLDELVFEGIKKQIYKKSLITFTDIAIQCLDYDDRERPTARGVIKELKKALEYQEDYETWEPKLPRDYEEILYLSNLDKMEKFKDIYDTLCKGFHLRDRDVYFSLGINGAKNYVISAAKFSFKYPWAQSWQRIPQSRFKKVAKMLTSSNLNIQIKMRTPRLSLDVNYAVHLVFKFCGKSSAKSVYVDLTYKMGSETFHAYFAISRDEDWMKIELCRFLNHKEDTNFEVLLESFSKTYCGSGAVYVEGIEFQSIDNVEQEDIEGIMDVQKQLLTDSDNGSENDDEGGKLFQLNEVSEKKHFRLSAIDVLFDSSKVKPFDLKPAAESRFQEGIELLPQQVFGIKCKIESQMLSPDTNYMCYLVFKLSEKCRGLRCPVRVRNVLQWKNKDTGLVCFRPPSAWDLLVTPRVPKIREDGWMEVMVWKFNSTSELRNDGIPMHLKFITYEGTMSGLIVSGLEIRPMDETISVQIEAVPPSSPPLTFKIVPVMAAKMVRDVLYKDEIHGFKSGPHVP